MKSKASNAAQYRAWKHKNIFWHPRRFLMKKHVDKCGNVGWVKKNYKPQSGAEIAEKMRKIWHAVQYTPKPSWIYFIGSNGMRKVTIATALIYWRMEYKGGRVVDLGYPKTNILSPEHGIHGDSTPTRGKTIGDLAQDAYMLMCANNYRKPAIALEITVFKPEMIWEDKEKALRQVGILCPTKLLLSQFAGVGALVMEHIINTGELPSFNPVKISCNSENSSVNSV